MFLPFALPNLFRATRARNFSFLISQDGPTPAAVASLLFVPPEPQNIGKTQCYQCFANFLPFPAPASSFFWFFLFSEFLSTGSFSSLTLPTSAFPSANIVGSLSSKLPSKVWFCRKCMKMVYIPSSLPQWGRWRNVIFSPGVFLQMWSLETNHGHRTSIDNFFEG